MARITFLLLLLWVGVTVSTVVDLQKRIFNGRNCSHQERLYHVSLYKNPADQMSVCGGSLIHPQWILTAAHCQKPTMYAVGRVDPGPRTTVKIQEKPVVYPDHDIMLLKLPSDIPGSKNILISLPGDGECKTPLNIGEVVGVAGHGDYEIDKKTGKTIISPAKDLKCATIKTSKCDNTAIKKCNPNEPDKNWICYEDKNDGACPGDSGGGVEYQGKLRAVIIGGREGRCTRQGISLDVCKYKQWIKKTIEGK